MKTSAIDSPKRRILFHVLILSCVIIGMELIFAITHWDTFTFQLIGTSLLQGATSVLLLLAPPIYFNIYWLIPKYLVKKRYLIYTLLLIIVIVGWGLVLEYGEPWIDRNWFDQHEEQPDTGTGIFVMVFIILISTLLHITYRWFKQLSEIKQIENDRLQFELSLLKNQINPHFFFNTLNNLYALSLEKSDETPTLILKLSEMMRYTIYDCKAPKVSISGEVTYLDNFISLQKMRHFERGIITFKKEISDPAVKIAPMILIVFLENAFKHGFDLMEKNAFINFKLKTNEELVHLYIENNFTDSENENQIGIGLENVKRRLSLIYSEMHELKIVKDKRVFSVDLKLYLQ
ncbi:MAG: two-component system LytT family sensor kinase [Sediminicola sp.]|jgi:two-component system LytT family sensor kinase